MADFRKGLGGKTRASLAALALVLLSLALASSAAALPAKFWGVSPQNLPTTEQFERLKRGGVDAIRLPIGWSSVEPEKGKPFDWSGIDPMVAGASAAGIDVLPFFIGAPRWAVPTVSVDRRSHSFAVKHLPVRNAKQRSGWTLFLREAVLRYGPSGTFWEENPEIAERPIRVWQIWNEENFKYFVARPNPGEYGKLLKLSYTAIKGADRGARILLGGMTGRPQGRRPYAFFASDFLNLLYKRTPGIKRKFNGVDLHPYTYSYQELAPEIEELRETLKENHDAGKGLWITEVGWSSLRPGQDNFENAYEKGLGGQARELKGAFRVLTRNARRWRLKQIFWFSIDDQAGACNFCDGSGLFGKNFKPKPAWYAYVHFAGGRP